MRAPRRNPDFRQRRPEASSVIPVVLLLESPVFDAGEWTISGQICSRLGSVHEAIPLAELSRCSLSGYALGAPVVANCNALIDTGDQTDGRGFQLRFAGTFEISKGWRLDIPGDWKGLRVRGGGYITGLITDTTQQALYPQGIVSYSGPVLQPPTPPAMAQITGIAIVAADTLRIGFDGPSVGGLVANGIWPVIGSSIGLPVSMTITGPDTVDLQYMLAISTGEIMTVPPYAQELLTLNGQWMPPVYWQAP